MQIFFLFLGLHMILRTSGKFEYYNDGHLNKSDAMMIEFLRRFFLSLYDAINVTGRNLSIMTEEIVEPT